MKVNEVIGSACNYLRLTLQEDLTGESSDSTITALASDKTASNLLFCLDRVLSELATTICGNVVTERFYVNDKTIDVALLEQPLIEVLKVTQGSQSIEFQQLSQSIIVQTKGWVDLVYSAEYNPCQWFGSFEITNKKLNRLIVYALCAEYCLVVGDYDNAYMWRDRYTAEVATVTSQSKSMVLPARRWC